jgi:hypothetical protein
MSYQRCPVPLAIQSLLFDKGAFDPPEMFAWLESHGYHATFDESRNYWRARQKDPSAFVPGSLRTVRFGRGGILAIFGCPLRSSKRMRERGRRQRSRRGR